MFVRKMAGMLLASSMFVAVSVSPVYADATEKTAVNDLEKYVAEYDLDSEDHKEIDSTDSLTEKISDEAPDLDEGREAANEAADAAEEAADEAQGYADETEGEEIEEAAEAAVEDAENARAASDLAEGANDGKTIDMAVEIAEAAQTEAEENAKKAEEGAEKEAEEARKAAEAEAAAREAEAIASAEYLGNFTLTAYCNCASCCGTAGNATASGVMPTSGHTVAMGGIDFGTKLLINGKVYTVEDRGTPYGHVDIFFDSHAEALQFGMSSADVYLVPEY